MEKKLIRIFDEILTENMKDQVTPINKTYKLEYYTDKDDNDKETAKSVEITSEDGSKKSFDVNSSSLEKKDSFQEMIRKGALIVNRLNLSRFKQAPYDIVVSDGKITQISGFKLKTPFSIFQVNDSWLKEKEQVLKLKEIRKKMKKESKDKK